MENIFKINDTLRRIDTTRQFFVPAAIEKSSRIEPDAGEFSVSAG
ncbi:hypothetical protein [Alistipes communis]|jgi:hypothetical protein|nr:hypothetical protein [Alistipes communis]